MCGPAYLEQGCREHSATVIFMSPGLSWFEGFPGTVQGVAVRSLCRPNILEVYTSALQYPHTVHLCPKYVPHWCLNLFLSRLNWASLAWFNCNIQKCTLFCRETLVVVMLDPL